MVTKLLTASRKSFTFGDSRFGLCQSCSSHLVPLSPCSWHCRYLVLKCLEGLLKFTSLAK